MVRIVTKHGCNLRRFWKSRLADENILCRTACMGISATVYRVFSHDSNPPYCVRMSQWWNVLFIRKKKKSWWNISFHAVPIWGRRVNAWNTCLQDVAHSWRQQNGGRNCASENALYLVTLVFVVCDSWIVLCQSASDSAHVTVVLGIITILRRDVSSSQTMQLYISANSG